jgi:MarR family transcriptional regulator, lower aerobic nicotinate degradation pathway regulator
METHSAPRRLRRLPSWLLAQASMEARRTVGEALAGEGAHRSEYALLASLDEFGPLSQVALSERIGLDRSDVVRLVDELEGRGLVERTQDPGDRRRNVISLLRAGQQRLDSLEDLITVAQGRLLSALKPAERKQLVTLLTRVLGVEG